MAWISPRCLAAGESAVVLELGDAISPELNAQVLELDRALRAAPFDGYLEAVPTYRSLLVFFDPARTDIECVRAHVGRLDRGSPSSATERDVVVVPTVYDGEDLDEVARLAGISREEVVRLHSGREYRVYMLGFTPGFAYMGPTHEKLGVGRRATPRTRVPAGSVAIAMGQTAVYPSATPGGWHLLGRAEHRDLFDASKRPPSRFLPGDRVRFVAVDALPALHSEVPAAPVDARGSPALEVEEAGLLTTVQDLGRFGYQRFGVPVAGAADAPALRAANGLVGNPPDAAGLECTVDGPALRAIRTVFVAVTGADLGAFVERPDLGRWRVPPCSSFLLRAGNRLRFDGRVDGARAYVAVAGGVDVPPVLGSRATYLTAGMGGFEGRSLRRGDRLATGAARESFSPRRWPRASRLTERIGDVELRAVLGPQREHFTAAALERLASSSFVVGAAADRMGYRLEGPKLDHRGAAEIVSDGMTLGAVQVPPDGQPIVMMADRATTGGYPKIATVIGPDVPRLAQLLPGDAVRFRPVNLDEARRAHREMLAAEQAVLRHLTR